MNPDLTGTLCTKCGLCCDGSLFADAELAGRSEATRLVAMGLAVDDDAEVELLVQPCVALRGRRCLVYAHRPGCCRTFECRLLRDVRRGALDAGRAGELVAEALERIGRVKRLLARLEDRAERLPLRERVAEALASVTGTGRVAIRSRVQLEAAMSSAEELLRTSFLPPEPAGRAVQASRPAGAAAPGRRRRGGQRFRSGPTGAG